MAFTTNNLEGIDQELSNRPLELDPLGYFIIYILPEEGLICAKHYSNVINEQGLAVDPETGKVIPAKGKVDRTYTQVFTGRTAKELCVPNGEVRGASKKVLTDTRPQAARRPHGKKLQWKAKSKVGTISLSPST